LTKLKSRIGDSRRVGKEGHKKVKEVCQRRRQLQVTLGGKQGSKYLRVEKQDTPKKLNSYRKQLYFISKFKTLSKEYGAESKTSVPMKRTLKAKGTSLGEKRGGAKNERFGGVSRASKRRRKTGLRKEQAHERSLPREKNTLG